MSASKKNGLLWTTQSLLAALFLFAGVMKLILPPEILQQGPIALPLVFLKFIGICEISGALGLILPGVFRIHRELTPLAAIGLVTIMTGATVVTVEGGSIGGAVVPFVVGVLASVVAFGRASTVRVFARA